MITTVTLNPCIDKTISISNFKYGELNRVVSTRTDVSGKGINVSIALNQLGEETKCLGFNYLRDDSIIKKRLEESKIGYQFIEVEGSLRTNIKIFDTNDRTMTELNESGNPVTLDAVELLKKMINKQTIKSKIMVFNGSVPKGVPKNIYKILIEQVKKEGVKTVLDAEGDLLLEGIKAKPYFIKPNLFELQNALKTSFSNNNDVANAAKKIIDNGVSIVCVSMGQAGAIIVSQEEAWFAPGSKLNVKGVQGAGDSLVAGMCIAMERGYDLREMLRYGVAAANASLIREGTLLCTKEDFKRMLSEVKIEKIL